MTQLERKTNQKTSFYPLFYRKFEHIFNKRNIKMSKILPAVTVYRGNFYQKKFTGKERDPETGLYYFGARYLDPKTSRWMSGDPAVGEYVPSAPVNDEAKKRNQSLPGQGGVFNYVNLHVYHYAGNNPVKYIDPDGKTDLDKIELKFNTMILGAETRGWHGAAANMRHFLNGRGATRYLDASWLKGFNSVQQAISRNYRYYESEFRNIATTMKDGDVIQINEYPSGGNFAFGPFGDNGYAATETASRRSEGDLYYASGTFTITSFCDVTLRKENGKVTVNGNMLNIFWDVYDWHPGWSALVPGFGYVFDSEAQALVDAGRASPYKMQSSWTESYTLMID